MIQLTTSVKLSGKTCVIPSEGMEPEIWRRANAFWNPLGPTPGEASVLMLRKDVEDIIDQRHHELEFNDHFDKKDRKFTIKKLYLKRASGVFTQGASDGQIYLVELTDGRGIAAKYSDTQSIQINVRSWAAANNYLDETLANIGGAVEFKNSWANLLFALWGKMFDFLGPFPQLPFQPSGTPENWRFNGVSAYDGLNEVLAHLGWAISFDPTDGNCDIVVLGKKEPLPALPRPIRDDRPFVGGSWRLPGTIRVYFTNWYKSYGQERDTETDDNWSAAARGGQPGVYESFDIATNHPDAGKGVLPLWDDLQIELDEDNIPQNVDDVQKRAQDVADNYIRDASLQPNHAIYPGIHSVLKTTGTIKSVYYRAWGPSIAGLDDGTATEATEHSGLPAARIPGDGVSAATGYGMSWRPVFEPMAPPDIARKSFPNFPRLPNLLQINSPAAQHGEYVPANEDGLYRGTVVRWVAGKLEKLESCFIRFVDDHDNKDGFHEVMNGTFCGPGRLSGVETSDAGVEGGTLLPLYTVTRPMTYAITVENEGDVVEVCGGAAPVFRIFPFDLVAVNVGTISPNPFADRIFSLEDNGGILIHGKGVIRLSYKVSNQRNGGEFPASRNTDDSFATRLLVNGNVIERSHVLGLLDDYSEYDCVAADDSSDVENDLYMGTASCPAFLHEIEAEDIITLEYARNGGGEDHVYTGKGVGRNSHLTIEFVNSFDVLANPVDP